MRRLGGRSKRVALSKHIWNKDICNLSTFFKHDVTATIIAIVKVYVNRQSWHLKYGEIDGCPTLQHETLLKKECVLYEMKNICQADDLFKVVAEKTSLCCKYGQLLTVEGRHNLKVLNVIVDLGRNVKTPLADERRALLHGCEAGNTVVAMVATDREEFIGKMQRVGEKGQDITGLLIEGDFVIVSQVLEQSLCADIMN